MTENVTKTIERGGPLRASTRSLHDLGLDNYPNPEFPEASRLTRKEEKSALQNLNNRLAGNYLIVMKINQFEISIVEHPDSKTTSFKFIGYIDRVRTLQNENHKLYHQVRTFEEYKQTEISNVKDLYDKQVRHIHY